jgi:hypothetical protein
MEACTTSGERDLNILRPYGSSKPVPGIIRWPVCSMGKEYDMSCSTKWLDPGMNHMACTQRVLAVVRQHDANSAFARAIDNKIVGARLTDAVNPVGSKGSMRLHRNVRDKLV